MTARTTGDAAGADHAVVRGRYVDHFPGRDMAGGTVAAGRKIFPDRIAD